MKAYSIDLRERVVAACDARDGTREQIAARFSRQRLLGPQAAAAAARDRLDRPQAARRRPGPGLRRRGRRAAPRGGPGRRRRHPGGAAPAPPAWRAAPRPCTGRWTGWASREKKVAAGGRAGPAGAEGRAGGLAGGVRRGRPGPAGLRRRERGEHGDGPHPRPRPSGVRVDGPVPHGHWKVVTLTAAVRLGGVPGGLPGLRRGDRHRLLRGLRRASAWRRPCGPATSW